ncbi:MAG TPA: hypothetical protein VGQ03_07810 [Nitrososphaera sp.]|jgi:hypothetical protein|nr:hypothetical protein [Nitrososphaera sp.]
MSESERKDDSNLFKLIDGVIRQVNKTKKIFIIMVVSIMVVPAILFAITFLTLDPSLMEIIQNRPARDPSFVLFRMIPIIISVVWLGVGIWQWFALSKWTKRYERFKQHQEELDRKLDTESGNESS